MTEDRAYYCKDMLKTYPYVIEMSEYPGYHWMEKFLTKSSYTKFDDYDNAETYTSVRYGMVQHPEKTNCGFIFFALEENYKKVLEVWSKEIISTTPFSFEL